MIPSLSVPTKLEAHWQFDCVPSLVGWKELWLLLASLADPDSLVLPDGVPWSAVILPPFVQLA